MRLSEDKIRRIAERLHDELEQRGLVAYKDPRGATPGARRADFAISRRMSPA